MNDWLWLLLALLLSGWNYWWGYHHGHTQGRRQAVEQRAQVLREARAVVDAERGTQRPTVRKVAYRSKKAQPNVD